MYIVRVYSIYVVILYCSQREAFFLLYFGAYACTEISQLMPLPLLL